MRLIWLLCLVGLLVGCAGREFIARGDELVERGRYQEAIRAYSKRWFRLATVRLKMAARMLAVRQFKKN